ncbi:MAG: hypothetical protein ACTSSE_02030 [Candidatus Thorarchaeota archaeon]
MDVPKEYRNRLITGLKSLDDRLLRIGRRQAQLFREYRFLIAVMLIGAIVWSVVFNIALVDYLDSSRWSSRHAWLGPLPGPGEFNFFGFTIDYQLEGYSDYSSYYVHWGHNLLNGVMPYSSDFGILEMNGIVHENGAYMFPPLTAYLYGAGIWLGNIIGPGNWGIGLLLASFGYLTALPVYGIAKELSKNPRVGEIAALTYLLNPLVLYHIDFIWLNPSAFYFFFFAGFYALVKDRRHIGTILIVTAAFFKQTAWFLGIPLVVFLLLRKRSYPDLVLDSEGPLEDPEVEKNKKWYSFLLHYFDFRAFAVSVVVAVSYAGALMLPTLLAEPHFWNYWRISMGHFNLESFTEVPGYGTPITIPVLAIVAGMPDLAEILETIFVSGGILIFGVVVAFGVMLLLDKMDGEEHIFMRRLLFITMLLMLWVSLTGPRGVYKYYFAMFGPFFSIFASGRMIRGKQQGAGMNDRIPVSLSMFLMPFTFTLLILIPERNTYLLYAIIVFVLYLLAPLFNRVNNLVKRPFRFMKKLVSKRIQVEIQTAELPYETPPSRKKRIMDHIIIIYSILIGAVLFLYGAYICLPQVTAAISLILQYFMVAGVLIFIGAQMLSIGVNGLSTQKKSRDDLNEVLQLLVASIAFVVLVFGLVSYSLSWNIELFFERQILVVASTFMMIWALLIVVKQKKPLRFLADILLITGASLATWIWISLGDIVMYTIGLACVAGLILHFMFLLLELLDSTKDVEDTSSAEIDGIETIAQ